MTSLAWREREREIERDRDREREQIGKRRQAMPKNCRYQHIKKIKCL